MASAGQMQGMICVIFRWSTLPRGASIPAPCLPLHEAVPCGVEARNKSALQGINL